MQQRAAIVVRNVSKKFRLFDAKRPMTLLESVVHGFRRLRPARKFVALDNVDFQIPQGKMIGIIGKNGAGKSTLLRLIGGVGRPDAGQIETNGRIGALLELGAGFHPDLTGRENVYVNGVIAGLTRAEVDARFDEIVAFAELAAFIDNPLRTYSSGMEMRLAFAVAAHIEPDILLIDEVLAVGDVAFQQKCLHRIYQFNEKGCTIVLVSHDISMVESLCDEVIWMRDGRVAAKGPAETVVRNYLTQMATAVDAQQDAAVPVPTAQESGQLQLNQNRFGNQAMQITNVEVQDKQGRNVTTYQSGEPLYVCLEYHAPQPLETAVFNVTITREDGLICLETNSNSQDITYSNLTGSGKILLKFERLDFNAGLYFIDVGVFQDDWELCYDYHYQVYPIDVQSSHRHTGIISPPHQWLVESL